MQRSLAVLLHLVVTVSLLATIATLTRAQGLCTSYTCPAGFMCACEDCSSCNSGSFTVSCMCKPVPGSVTCTVSNGDCAFHICAMCQTVSKTQTCTTYEGCPGQVCGTSGCTSGGNTPLSVRYRTLPGAPGLPEVAVAIRHDIPVELTEVTGNGASPGFS